MTDDIPVSTDALAEYSKLTLRNSSSSMARHAAPIRAPSLPRHQRRRLSS